MDTNTGTSTQHTEKGHRASAPGTAGRPRVVVAGGGPAGMLSGLLLARAGVRVTVVEQYPDFNRDFRGDTIHPSTLELLGELGWLDEFLALPHDRMSRVEVSVNGRVNAVADFSRLPVRCPFVAIVPQWDLLNFLADKASSNDNFTLLRRTRVTGLRWADGIVAGVTAEQTGPTGEIEPVELTADLVIGADGRHSTVRGAARLRSVAAPSPIDVLWLRLPRHPGEQLPLFTAGDGALISINRGTYWQLACVVPAGGVSALKRAGLQQLRNRITDLQPGFGDRVDLITDWQQTSELTVRVDHLRRWSRPGLLCIGDAAHAMSPAGGVGINLAIQDAVATANLLGPVLRDRPATAGELAAVQRRRSWAARITQFAQLRVPSTLYPRGDQASRTPRLPAPLWLAAHVAPLRRLTGRFVGLGLRPEHLEAA